METKMCLFYFVSLLLFKCCSVCMATNNLTTDQSALLSFKAHITSDPYSLLGKSWSISNPVCNWVGISCASRHERVKTLNLSYMSLEGTIPPHLGNLSFLVYLDLWGNNFHGHLPNELGQLRRLRVIEFSYNNLSGGFPIWIGILSKLRHLGLYSNKFTGMIPQSLFNLSKLEVLEIRYNNIEGKISMEIGRLSNLKEIFMGNNKLSGSIPSAVNNISLLQLIDLKSNSLSGVLPFEIGKLPNLKALAMGQNQLSGSIPSAIFNISSLQRIGFHSNSLSGSLPDDLCNSLPKLEFLNLAFNEFFGQLSRSLGNCRELINLTLSYNKFTGSIPENIGNLSKLAYLFLSNNNLKGPIPSTIYNISSSKLIYLANNSLLGTIPMDLCHNLPIIEHLSLGSNNIGGSIPRNIKNCTLLKYLNLEENFLTGEIPYEIGNLQNLVYLYLDGNSLTGPIPPTIFNISTITDIVLYENKLSGHLPSSFGHSVPNLEQLTVATNKLSGRIPPSISNASKLFFVELGANSFSGHIPSTFGNLKLLRWLNLMANDLTTKSCTAEWSFLSSLTNCRELTFLGLSFNPLCGVLPSSIGNISTSLQYFYADNCKLKGSIPRNIGNLQGLIVLSLLNNDFNGTIPTTMGRLQRLQGLNLHGNNLQGSIPDDLCYLKGLYGLWLDNNNLSGLIPMCLANLTSLRELYLGYNKLTSTIPSSLWTLTYILTVNFSSNYLTGSLSSGIQNLKVLISFDLSRNQLSGDIPFGMGNLKDLVTLSLSSNRFQGRIPNSFGSLKSLESLDLSSNDLSGEIPKSLEALSYLKHFNVSVNKLEGEIPSGGPFRYFSTQSFMQNYALCGSPRLQVQPCKDDSMKRSKKIGSLLLKSILPPTISTLLIVIAIIIFMRCRNESANIEAPSDSLPLAAWRRIPYLEIQRATNGFNESNLLGTGSFGSIYKGILSDGTIVAIKVFNSQLERAFKSFDSECEVLRNIRHRNLIKIFSSCCNIDFKALIIEFMPNGSLEKWLHSHNYFLDILERLNIMIDVALALEYLHHNHSSLVIHCDLKPSNILLDKNMVAHVSDFGIAKLLGEGDSWTQTITMATIGYMAPEYGTGGFVSASGDVYSYGVLLMETFTRKKPTDEMFADVSLKSWVKGSLPHELTRVVDGNLLREERDFAARLDCMLSIMDLALDCCMESPKERINMIDAAAKLEKIRTKFLNYDGAGPRR